MTEMNFLETTDNESLANILPIPLVFLDNQLRIVSWNPIAGKMLNLHTELHHRLPINELFHKVDFLEYIAQKNRGPIEASPSQPPATDLSLLLVNYQQNGYVLIIRDVTQIHHLERMRQDFVANVSHELRTPLTVFHGYLEMLLEQSNTVLQPWKKILEQMYQQSLRMQKLIEDLLLLSRLENEVPENKYFKLIDVSSMLESIYEDAKALSGHNEHNLQLIVEKDLKLYGLENELMSAFSNLIFNAINYTPPKGNIRITWQKDGTNIYLEVQDTGIGIASGDIPRLTERFYRVDKARSRSSGGTGLGLAIVKHVLLLHKASLKITSQLNKGSTFTCIFPQEQIISG